MKPFDPLLEMIHIPMTIMLVGSIPLTDRGSEIVEIIGKLEKADTWASTKRTMETAVERFEKA